MKKMFIVSLILILLSGCGVKNNVFMTINEDKSLNLVVLEAYDNETIDGALKEENNKDKTYTDEERWEFLDERLKSKIKDLPLATAEKYENGDYKGYKFIIDIANIDEITGDGVNFNLDNILQVPTSKIFKKEDNEYISQIHFTGIDIIENVNYDLSFSVTLPFEPLSHNATTVSDDKKTLTWNLVSTTDKDIKFSFNFPGEEVVEEKNNNKLIIGISVSAVVSVIVVLVILKFRKKEEL